MVNDSDESSLMPSWLVVYIKGICMGAADAVPGVSGGTIALIVGIYERLITAVTAITPRRIRAILSAPHPHYRESALAALRTIDIWFLVALGAGILSAIITITRIVHAGIISYPAITFGFFFGLIAASAWVLRQPLTIDTPGRIVAAAGGFLVAFIVSGQAATALGQSLPVTILAGAVAVSAMILPGISGSLLLVILGQYEYMTGTLSVFVDASIAVLTGGSFTAIIETGTVVVAFVSGAVFGLFSIAHAVRWALERYYEATFAFLVALIVGALRAPVVRVGTRLSSDAGTGWTPSTIALFITAALVGVFIIIFLERAAGIGDVDMRI